jgi:hypothetical protein
MSGGAPYWGRATKGWQSFVAASNTITQVGVTWSDTHYTPGAALAGVTTRISLCQGVGDPNSPDPCAGRIADGHATVINQGDSRIDFGDIDVTPGVTYYVFYYQPTVDAGAWDMYWWNLHLRSRARQLHTQRPKPDDRARLQPLKPALAATRDRSAGFEEPVPRSPHEHSSTTAAGSRRLGRQRQECGEQIGSSRSR